MSNLSSICPSDAAHGGGFPAPETTRWRYTHGAPDVTAISPDGYSRDNFYLARTGADEIQLDLLSD